ncbi:MAG: class I SAM-dependent methyltransferase [Myxococcota bacterium]|jgi:SAM-dependent methyltransferase|nr:class I SAM-dependent methyltransferase [Myxococcota bacterium]
MNNPKLFRIPLLVVLSLVVMGCKRESSEPVPAQPPTETQAPTPTEAPSDPAASGHTAHAPIDCPLRKQGINPTEMRPFDDAEKYIAFLEREDRASWQKPEEVLKALELKGDETLFDVGAGSGYFSFRFASALPKGLVIAADTDPEMVRHLHHKSMTEGIANVRAKLIESDNPGLEEGVDLVFICDVLHHVGDRPAWMSKLAEAMPSGARLAVIEFRAGELPAGPPDALKIAPDEVRQLAQDAGLELSREEHALLPYQYLLIFRKP